MNRRSFLILSLVTAITASGLMAAVVVQDRKVKKVKRVKRPTFTQRDWDGIYFNDLFAEGLVGQRPSVADQVAAQAQAENTGEASASGEFAWTNYISGSTIEDEVKALQSQLIKDITTPVKFKSEYNKAHQSFSMLSMLFAIIREYDGDVRWERSADVAQVSFERAAANSRVGTIQAYESCKRRKEDLQELIRGGNFAGQEKAPDELDWSIVVDRTPIMKRLEISNAQLKQLTANEGSFKKEIETIAHESELVAAMAETIIRENMTDAEDDGYVEFAKAMSAAAVSVTKACENEDYDAASNAVNLIGQSCSNCHDEWR